MYPNIEAERVRNGMSKAEFAKKLGVSTKTYYNWIKGINPIPSTYLIKMAKMCNSEIDYLLGINKEEKEAVWMKTKDIKVKVTYTEGFEKRFTNSCLEQLKKREEQQLHLESNQKKEEVA